MIHDSSGSHHAGFSYENLFAKGELARTIPDVDLCTLSTESFTISERCGEIARSLACFLLSAVCCRRSKLNWLAKIVAQEFAPLSPGNRHWCVDQFQWYCDRISILVVCIA